MYDKVVRLSLGQDFSRFIPYSIKFSELPKLLCSSNVLYSPVQFNDGIRKSANFLGFADFLVLDFDEGWNEYHENLFNQYIGYKVPTKSHMKDKGGIICERYRIILLLATPLNLDKHSYKYLYKHIMNDLKLNSDTSCVDTARFYYSAPQPVENCIELKGTEFFPWKKFNYKDLQYASLNQTESNIDITDYKDMDLSYLPELEHSKRYECPLCAAEGLDPNKHHLGFNKDEDYPTCFYDETHSKILRKVYKIYKYGEIENKMEAIQDMVREKCTEDLIKVGKYNPQPTNYTSEIHSYWDKALDAIEKDSEVCCDIETFSEEYVAETYEEAEQRLCADYKYIKGAYDRKCGEYSGVALDPFKNKIRIITLEGGGVACPFDMYFVTPEQKQRILNCIKRSMIIGHNLKFDIKSIMVKYCFDTMIASRMIHMACDPEDQQSGHNLEATAFRFLNFKMDKHIEHTWGEDNLSPEQLKYCGMDVKVLRPIYKEQVRQFKQIYGDFDTENYDIEKLKFLGPLVNVHPILALEMQTLLEVIRIEHTGVKPNIPMMEEKIEYYDRLIEDTDAELGINCGSAKQCIQFLKERVNPNIDSSSQATLSEYWDNPIVEKISNSKMARTRRGLMVSMSDTNIHPYDGRIHPNFNQLLNTGRFSCSGPNMQQIPKDIKNTIYQSSEDGAVFDTDYAAVELRLATVVSNDPVMLENYKNGVDMHYYTASKLYKKEIPHTEDEKEDAEKNPNSKFISKQERGLGKMTNFGLIYGMHWTTFQCHGEVNGFDMTDKEAQDYVDTFFKTYTGLKKVIDDAKNLFLYGQDVTIPRWIRFKNGSLNKMDKQVPFFTQCKTLLGRRLAVDTERKLMNYPVQGSGADAIKLGICWMGYKTREKSTSYKTINLVHDDTIGESKLIDFDINSAIFREALEFAINYILRYKFYTPVNQDFCILSMFGEEVFLEEALTLQDAEHKLVEKIQHGIQKLEKETNQEEKTKKIVELNREHRILQKLRKVLEEKKTIDNKELATV